MSKIALFESLVGVITGLALVAGVAMLVAHGCGGVPTVEVRREIKVGPRPIKSKTCVGCHSPQFQAAVRHDSLLAR